MNTIVAGNMKCKQQQCERFEAKRVVGMQSWICDQWDCSVKT